MIRPSISKPALVTVVITASGQAADHLHRCWSAGDDFELTQGFDRSGLSSKWPDTLPRRTFGYRLVAGRQAAGPVGLNAAYLFAGPDCHGVVTHLAPGSGEPVTVWRDLTERWRAAIGPDRPPGVLVDSQIITALTATRRRLTGERLTRLLPPPWRQEAQHGWAQTDTGMLIWKDNRAAPAGTRLGVLAPAHRERDLDDLLWSDGSLDVPPMVRYLLHAAMLRRQMRQLRQVMADLDVLTDRAGQYGIPTGGHRGSAARRRPDADRLAEAATRLGHLRITSEITRDNLTAAAPVVVADDGRSPLAGDTEVAGWVANQGRYAAGYLDNARARLAAAHRRTENTLRERQTRATLAQTSLLGGLLMALAAIQAMEFRVPLPPPVQAPTITVLAALAVALPMAVADWSGARRPIRTRWATRAGLAWCAGATGWLVTAIVGSATRSTPVPAVLSGLVAGCAAGVVLFGTAIVERNAVRRAARD